MSSLKRDRNLFSTLYIACQTRDADPEEFFRHENQSFPASLSDYANMRFGTKSDLIGCLEESVTLSDISSTQPNADMIVIDGAAIVNMIKPGPLDTFDGYASKFMDYTRSQFSDSVRRVNIVFDVYKTDSLKAATRKKRGKGTRRRVEGRHKVPGNWPELLREDDNKTELFALLSARVTTEEIPGKVVITDGEEVRCSEEANLERLSPCTHEEADTRILLHVADGVMQGSKKLLIRTVDTDVVVLTVSLCNKLGCERLWVAFGTGKSFRYLDATAIAAALGADKCNALPAFHALTGCDTTSCFAGRGKRTAWSAWSAFNDVTPALCTLAQTPTAADISTVLPVIERYVVVMYDRGSSDDSVNKARQVLFTQKHPANSRCS